jgi:hypothetical protein
MWRGLKRASAVGLVIGSVGFVYRFSTDEQLKRNLILWKELGPIITHYRLIELKQKFFPLSENESNAEYHSLHQKYSSKEFISL